MTDHSSNLVVVGCSNHHEKLVSGLWNFFLDNHAADFQFQWNGRLIRTHRLLLDVFLSPDKLLEAASGENCIQQQTDCSLDSLLEFMYKGTVSIPREQLGHLLEIARESDFQSLVEALESPTRPGKLRKSFNTNLPVPELSLSYDNPRKRKNSSGYQYMYGNVKGTYSEGSDASNDLSNDSDVFKDPSYDPDERPGKSLRHKYETRSSVPQATPVSTQNDETKKDEKIAADKTRATLQMFVCKHCKYRTLTGDLMLIHLHLSHNIGSKPGAKKNTPYTPRHKSQAAMRRAMQNSGVKKPVVPKPPPKVKPKRVLQRCNKCPYTSFNPLHFKVHCDKHDPANIVRYQCPHCPYTNKSKSQLGYHVKGYHSAVKPYRCTHPGCNYSCRMKTNLRIHVEVAHLDMKPYVCEKCAYRTWSQPRLNKHLLVHSDERQFKCQVCDRTYRHPSSLKLHVKTHTGEDDRNHVCHLCGSAFRRRDTMITHLRSVHKTQFPVGTNLSFSKPKVISHEPPAFPTIPGSSFWNLN